MNWFLYHVETELQRLEREHPPKDTVHRRQWFLQQRQSRMARTRALAWWFGGRLVGAGERLRSWSAVPPQQGTRGPAGAAPHRYPS